MRVFFSLRSVNIYLTVAISINRLCLAHLLNVIISVFKSCLECYFTKYQRVYKQTLFLLICI